MIARYLTDAIRDLAPRYGAHRIASLCGVSHAAVLRRAEEAGITLLDRETAYRFAMQDVPNSAGAIAAVKRRRIPIPKWVPQFLHEEYREFAVIYGEEGAASHVRRLKAEMRAAS